MRLAPVALRLLLTGAALLAGCQRAAPRLAAERVTVIDGLAATHCRDCHQRSVSDALPNALAVFDLDKPAWLAGIPEQHLKAEGAFMARLLPHADAPAAAELRAALDAELERRRRTGD